MNKAELNQTLEDLFETRQLIAEIYFVLKEDNTTYIRMLDIEQTSQNNLTQRFVDVISEGIINNEALEVISISEADERANVLYHYDLEEIPQEFSVMDEIANSEDIPTFIFNEDSLNNIKAIIILLQRDENRLLLYKKYYPVDLYRKDRGINIKRWGNNHRFAELDDDIVRINTSFEFFKINNSLIIKDLNALERFFGFHDIIIRKAQSCIDIITNSNIVENPNDLLALTSEVSFARKLTKAALTSPVLIKKIPPNTIIAFTETHPKLIGKFKYSEDKSKLHLATKASKILFIKLLNDDYLHSQLTTTDYDSIAKDKIESA